MVDRLSGVGNSGNVGDSPGSVDPNLQKALTNAQQWLASQKPGTPGYAAASKLVREIQMFIQEGKSFSDLTTWVNSFNNSSNKAINNDIYWECPGLSQDEANEFYQICGAGNAPAPTQADNMLSEVYEWMQNSPQGSNDWNTANAIFKLMETGGFDSMSSPSDIAQEIPGYLGLGENQNPILSAQGAQIYESLVNQ